MDVSALSALQLAIFVGRSFVSFPLHGPTLKMDMAALSALPLAVFVGRTFVYLDLCLWLEDGYCCAVCVYSSLRLSAGAAYIASGLKLDVSALSALQLAMFIGRSFVSWLLVLISVDTAALSALVLAGCVGRSFVSVPLVL